MRRLFCLFLFCFLLLSANSSQATSVPWYTLVPAKVHDAPVLRALLIGCDDFAGEESLVPSAKHNVEAVERILLSDMRGYASIRTAVNERLDKGAFQRLIREAFRGAKKNDISFFYISTHGMPDKASGYALLTSDGKKDEVLTDRQLFEALNSVPGEKVVWVDACNSGMVLNRGMSALEEPGRMAMPGFQVMTSSGGGELSYFWNSAGISGGSYLVTALEQGLTEKGRYAADADKDMRVTMGELQAFLQQHYGASTPQFYPSAGDFPLLHYMKPWNDAGRGLVTDLVFDETTLTGGERTVDFSYTLNKSARIAYQMVYEKNGVWQFTEAQVAEENESRHGIVRPGRISRSLHLQDFGAELYGYVLFMIVAVDEDRMEPLATALLSVEEEAEETPQVFVVQSFSPEKGEEAVIFVGHEKPCTITVVVRNEQGDIVASPVYEQMSRPQHLDTPGSLFYWRGVDDAGELLPKGSYSLQITIRMGNKSMDAFSRALSIE